MVIAHREPQPAEHLVLDRHVTQQLIGPRVLRVGIPIAPHAEIDIGRRADLVLLGDVVAVQVAPRPLVEGRSLALRRSTQTRCLDRT